jgi:mycofactocin system glycosyltransferase
VRRIDGGAVLVGGSPLRLLRLTAAGARLVDRFEAGEPVPGSAAATRLARRLLDGGLAHPRPDAVARPYGPGHVAVVIPVRDRAEGLARTLAQLTGTVDLRGQGSADGGREPGGGAAVDNGGWNGHGATDVGESDRGAAGGGVGGSESAEVIDAGGVAPVRPCSGDGVAEIVVVDDGSLDASAVADVSRRCGARVVRHGTPRGPGAARNTGWRATTAPVVAFVDADVEPATGWLPTLLAHLADTTVVAVAPRIVTLVPAGVPEWLAAYERARSPLDLGPAEAPVRPGSRVPYVPTAALLVRRDVLVEAGGFDEAMTHGEDVDLVWRLAAAGHTIRYEPRATVAHPVRPDLAAWLRQRYGYGSSAAPLALRHPGAVAPLTVSGWSAAAWGLVVAGAPTAGIALGAATTAALVPRLRNLTHPWREAGRLAGIGNLYAGRQVADALRRAWVPLLVPMALRARSRPVLAAALVVPALVEWVERRPGLDPARWAALRLADDLAYAAGLWAGSRAAHTTAALRPAFSGRFPPPEPAATPEVTGSAEAGPRH